MSLLLYAGGFTTSIEAGMAFLDWPLSNGSLNPDGWTQQADQLAEHSHRLMGMKMGILSLVLFALCWRYDSRKFVVRLAAFLVFIIVLQGILGGLRVLLDQQNTGGDSNWVAQVFLILHACGAQLTLCTLVTLVIVLSKYWRNNGVIHAGEDRNRLLFWAKLSVGSLCIQLLLGALVRHLKATAIFGSNFPMLTPEFQGIYSFFPEYLSLQSIVHYLHRGWAIVVCFILLKFFTDAWRIGAIRKHFSFWLTISSGLLAVQIFLGALVVWTLRNPYSATIHTLCGACILAITWGMTVCFHQKEEVAG